MNDEELAAATAGVEVLSKQIRPLLAGKGPHVQGATLADLAALWLWGHQIQGDPVATADLRRAVFEAHIDAIWGLVELIDTERSRA